MSRAAAGALAAALALAPHGAIAGTTLGATHEFESLDTGPNWTRNIVSIERRASRDDVLNLEWRRIERFDVRDDEFMLGGHTRVADEIGLAVEFSGAESPAIVPEFATRIDVDVRLPDGFVCHLIGRRANYPEDTANGVGAGIEWYRGNGRLAYELVSTSLQQGDSGAAHVVHADWYYSDENRVGIAGAIGDEATRISADDVIVADVRSAALVGRHWLGARWGVAWAATWTEQGDFHTRTGGSLGILFRL